MRFHHSTRRGRNRLAHNYHNQHASHPSGLRSLGGSSRWSQLGYCRETNLHFHCRLPIEPPSDINNNSSSNNQQSLFDAASEDLFVSSEAIMTSANRRLAEANAARQCDKGDTDSGSAELEDLKLQRLSLRDVAGERAPAAATTNTTSTTKQPNKAKSKHNKLAKLATFSTYARGKKSDNQLAGSDTASCCSKQQQQQQQQTFGKLDMESARERLVAQVEKHPFWSNKAARRMKLTAVEERRIYIYELISYCERRELEWRFEPYKGGLVPSTPYRRRVDSAGAGAKGSGYDSAPISPGSTKGLDLASAQMLRGHSRSSVVIAPAATMSTGATTAAPGAAAAATVTTTTADQLQPRQQLQAADVSPIEALDHLSAASTMSMSNSNCGAQVSEGRASGTTAQQQQQRHQTGPGSTSSSFRRHARQTAAAAAGAYEPVSALGQRHEPSAELVWSIEAPGQVKPEPFAGCVHSTELPNSSFVKRCHGCQGRGRIKCNSCYGVGYEVCISCSGKGTTKSLSAFSSSSGAGSGGRSGGGGGGGITGARPDYSSSSSSANARNSTYANGYDPDAGSSSTAAGSARNEPGGITNSSGSASAWVTDTCHYCHGAGQKRCWVCAGKSYNFCLGCSGTGQLRCFLNVNITWINHRDESILNNADNIIPRERLRLSSGLALADQVANCLGPLSCARIEGATGNLEEARQLEAASKRLLERHAQTYCRQERLIKQRHRVTQIECHVVSYEWKQRKGHFVIYGDERKVYIAKYPFKSICSIT